MSDAAIDLTSVHRDLGRVEGRLTAVENELASFKSDFRRQIDEQGKRLDSIDKKLDTLTTNIAADKAERKGGRRMAEFIAAVLRHALTAMIAAGAALGIRLKIGS